MKRVIAALDEHWHEKLRPRMQPTTAEDALHLVMDRMHEFADDRLDKDTLRFEVLRTLVKIAWNRPWQPVAVEVRT